MKGTYMYLPYLMLQLLPLALEISGKISTLRQSTFLGVRVKKIFFHDACKVQYVGTYSTVYVYIPVSSYLYRCNIYMCVRYIAAGSLAVTKMVSSPFDSVPFHPQTE